MGTANDYMSKSYNSNRAAMTSKVGKSKLRLGSNKISVNKKLKFTEYSDDQVHNVIDEIQQKTRKQKKLQCAKNSFLILIIIVGMFFLLK